MQDSTVFIERFIDPEVWDEDPKEPKFDRALTLRLAPTHRGSIRISEGLFYSREEWELVKEAGRRISRDSFIFFGSMFTAAIIGLVALVYGLAYSQWAVVWGGFSTLIVVMAAILVSSRK